MKRIALFALWIALVVECGYLVWARIVLHTAWSRLAQPLVFAALFATLAVTRGRNGWITTILRVLLAYEFGLAVADRLGWLGPPGGGVAWGDFSDFVAYTRRVNAFLPGSFAFPLAVLATIAESIFALALIAGIWLRYTAASAAILLVLFGSAMTASGLNQSQFFYAVFVLATGAWVISTVDPSWLSIDRLLQNRRAARIEAAPTSA